MKTTQSNSQKKVAQNSSGDSRKIKLISSDNKTVKTTVGAIKQSEVISSCLELTDTSDGCVNVPNLNFKQLKRIIEWCNRDYKEELERKGAERTDRTVPLWCEKLLKPSGCRATLFGEC